MQGTVVVQEIFPNGLIDRDDRLKVGDQILEVRNSLLLMFISVELEGRDRICKRNYVIHLFFKH